MTERVRRKDEGQRAGGDARALPPLVEAKLALPAVRRATVDRPRLRETLDAGREAALTLVAAPAGYGKTTAVRAWSTTVDAALAWVTLDAGDNDPVRLWRYVATAVDRVRSGLGRSALQRLDVPGSSIEDAVDELMNGMAVFGEPLLLVLDDAHTVDDEDCLASIDHALGHLPANARMIVLTRADPQLRLAGLRAGGALVELRASELAFTPAEAQLLLVKGWELGLGTAEVELLVERTEGWPAAIVLAGLWLQTVDDRASAVRAFGGEHQFVADYLSGEVLASLDDERRSFLQGVAVLGQFTAELCDQVLERVDSAQRLAELEHSNLFILRLERTGWFRIHSLFAEYAIGHLAALDPGAATRIHKRAARWLRAQGLPIQAVEHAAAAADHELVADLLIEYHLPLIRSGAGRTFLHWLRTLPDERVVEHPELGVAGAIGTILAGGSTVEQRRLLRLAERANEGRSDSSDPYFENWGLVARALAIEGGVAQAVGDGRRAVDLASGGPPESDEVITGALAAYARALFFAGDLDEASAAATRALEHPEIERRPPSRVHALATLALVCVERERLVTARSNAVEAKALVGHIGSSRSWLGANASAALGVVFAAEGRLVEAEHELVTAERFFGAEAVSLHGAWLRIQLARVRARRGHVEEAEAVLRSAREALAGLDDAGRVPELADDVERELGTVMRQARSGELLEAPSDAELAVLRLLDSDLSVREIGEQLFLSPSTIRTHVRALYRKLGVHSREDAVARASALGLLEQTQSSS